MGADKLFKSTPSTPKFYLPKLSNQAQKFEIFIKKRIHWVSVVRVYCMRPHLTLSEKEDCTYQVVLQYQKEKVQFFFESCQVMTKESYFFLYFQHAIQLHCFNFFQSIIYTYVHLHEICVSRTLGGPLLTQKSPTCMYTKPKTVVVETVLVIFM